MEITIRWQKPIQLTKHKRIIVDEDDLPAGLRAEPGVYFFSRKFGTKRVPFYIGESQNVRARLKQHLATTKIADVLRSLSAEDDQIKIGVRFFHFGYLLARPGHKPSVCLKIVQKALIRQAVEQGHPILNTQLKKFRTHNLHFEGGKSARATYDSHIVVEA